jgi:hypothetical protein
VRDPSEADLNGSLYLTEQEESQSAYYLILSDEPKSVNRLYLNPVKFKAQYSYPIINYKSTAFIQYCFDFCAQQESFYPLHQKSAVVVRAGEALWLLKTKGQLGE